MKKNFINRLIIYAIGLCVLALGIMLNSKCGLGVSPILSSAYAVADITGTKFGDITLILYILMIIFEVTAHAIRKEGKAVIIKDMLQIVVSIIFTRVMNLLSVFIPDFGTDFPNSFWGSVWGQLIVLAAGIIFTGAGVYISTKPRMVPNPGDGIVQTISDMTGKSLGFIKNCVDCTGIILAVVISLIAVHHLIGVGIGSILAMLLTGRAVAIVSKAIDKPVSAFLSMDEANS